MKTQTIRIMLSGLLVLAAAQIVFGLACSPGDYSSGSDGDTDNDTDGDTDGDSDSDGDTDTDTCVVPDGEMNGTVISVEETETPDTFNPVVQWSWAGLGSEVQSIVTPLVANLTDDDGSGDIDLCDVPDIVVVAGGSETGYPNTPGHIFVLDGLEGTLHFRIETAVDGSVTPALGDIDGDAMIEIVTATTAGNMIAFEHDGTLKWTSSAIWSGELYVSDHYSGAVALADLDNDGDVEIVAGKHVFDHEGVLLWSAPVESGNWSASTAADLDGDGDLEVILGNAAYHHNGEQYYYNAEIEVGYPQVADLDTSTPEPEILVTNVYGISLLTNTGATIYKDLRPTGEEAGGTTWIRPATIHDFDGDEQAEYALSSANQYTVYEADGTIVWNVEVSDQSGIAAGTAFDFLGIGKAQAMYADEFRMFVFDETGNVLMETPRASGTLSEYPVVADVDNDGSAEIIVVSNNYMGSVTSPTVQVIADSEDKWIQSRRIWNQHTYHVTNVAEDGTIPQYEPASWEFLNTFRTNAQIEGGIIVDPVIIE